MHDTPIRRADILNMDQPSYEQWLTGVRERMMAFRRKYEEIERAKSLARVDKLTPKLEKLAARLHKKMDKIDVEIDKIQDLINTTFTLMKEIDDERQLGEGRDGHPELELGRPVGSGDDEAIRDPGNDPSGGSAREVD